MNFLLRQLERLSAAPRGAVFGIALPAMLIVHAADVLTGPNYDLWLLYVPAVAAVAWSVGFRAGAILSVFVVLLWIGGYWWRGDLPAGISEFCFAMIARLAGWLGFAFLVSQLREARQRELKLAGSDPLTGLANVKSYMAAAEAAAEASRLDQSPIATLFIDCDHFKRVNDRFGHPHGDALLKQVADTIRVELEEGQLAARVGGDEFAVLCPGLDEAAARKLVERLKTSLDTQMQNGGWPVTFSIGVAIFPAAPQSVADLIGEADNLMYAVKHSTRNGVRYKVVNPAVQETVSGGDAISDLN